VNRFKLLVFLTIVLSLVVACGGGENAATPIPPTPTPTPQELLDRGISAFNGTESFHFDLALENRTLAVDQSGLLSFTEAAGDVRPPDSLQASTVIQSAFGNINVGFVAIGDQQWLTNPLDGNWEATPPELQTNVALLFDPEQGLGAALAELENLERLADETIDEVNTVHLRGTLPGATLALFAPELADQPALTVDLYFAADSFLLERVVMVETATEGEETPMWTFDFSEHNAAPEIAPPI
jgi:hypothetical protein